MGVAGAVVGAAVTVAAKAGMLSSLLVIVSSLLDGTAANVGGSSSSCTTESSCHLSRSTSVPLSYLQTHEDTDGGRDWLGEVGARKELRSTIDLLALVCFGS